MRTAFVEALMLEAERDPRIWLLTGDLGYGVLEPFAKRFPDRFMNVGVAEQNMTGMAAGLAMAGKVPYTYSIGNFSTLRCLEQIRNDVCYHELNVRVISVGGGLAYGSLGYSHHAIEDLAILRSLPNLAVLAPGDPTEVRGLVQALTRHHGPAYLRLGKANEPALHTESLAVRIGQALQLRAGEDVALLSTGGTLELTLKSADRLAEQGIRAAVFSVPSVKPLDAQLFELPRVVTVEEGVRGGLGSAMAESIVLRERPGRMKCVYLDSNPIHVGGSQSFLRERLGVSEQEIIKAAQSLMARVA